MKLKIVCITVLSLAPAGALAGTMAGNPAEPASPVEIPAGFKLEWPVDCTVGKTCFIQHYFDRDFGPAAEDYMCGTMTYQRHNGVDIRLLSMKDKAAGVNVLAAAPGTVLRVRDGMEDVSVATTGREAVRGRECGNGLVVQNEGKLQTQYCHMARGSIVVHPGDRVKVGQKLGQVGLSGDTEFPHLHFTVMEEGTSLDPFAVGEKEGECGGGTSLWDPALKDALAYHAGTVLNAGFATQKLSMADVESGGVVPPKGTDAPAIVAYVRSIGLRQGDQQRLVVRKPDGSVLIQQEIVPLDENKDQYLMLVGRKRPPEGWAAGTYAAEYTVTRDGKTVVEKSFSFQF
ncbi:Peptidase family M23 [Faunimonas pinastri]|uniref:Peptidase family M23 n=1 Tax=Faunimonas pinastri TaxID=1855383 RepID=A0A1H9F9N5_9HYPH|nr:M23 family metallopeptidase [Faunimonas pinastri]SEQ34660.1 Peptidase family M23 [Faunimonas pinastri]